MSFVDRRTVRALVVSGFIVCLGLLGTPGAHSQDTEIPLGTAIPGSNLQLPDQDGNRVRFGDLHGRVSTVVIFWSNRCPWTAKYRDRVLDLIERFPDPDHSFVLVNSNDPGAFPNESAVESGRYAEDARLTVPYLSDAESSLARLFGASRAPHVFVFDANQSLVYVGAIDDSPGDPGNVSARYVEAALGALASGGRIAVDHTKAFGCMIRMVPE